MYVRDEDEVAFMEGANLRVLRGTIVSEDKDFVHMTRADGDWSIAKSKIIKVRRRSSGKGLRP